MLIEDAEIALTFGIMDGCEILMHESRAKMPFLK